MYLDFQGPSNGLVVESNNKSVDKLIERQSITPTSDLEECTTPTPPIVCNGNGTTESLNNDNNNAETTSDIEENKDNGTLASPGSDSSGAMAGSESEYMSASKTTEGISTMHHGNYMESNGQHPLNLSPDSPGSNGRCKTCLVIRLMVVNNVL